MRILTPPGGKPAAFTSGAMSPSRPASISLSRIMDADAGLTAALTATQVPTRKSTRQRRAFCMDVGLVICTGLVE